MPRYTLHQPKTAAADGSAPADLRSDQRVSIIAEMPRLLLIECPEAVAEEWLARMPGWKMQPEHRVTVPDPRPKPS
ncbi:hypothetical protein VT84_17220 [Gemmata sp. SH-PL17]|uniref:hypothetical protein n=1 Tax=Gemmata sp. SH-PL17 TaxID=1630693 RepID=UPI0004BCC433|nr:hypothetical protein [Gemmata sp. SH-PL17]AMV26142.1 hypothetical protein VT84_17220 [Gemmata sp. SH-PL17]